MKFLLGDFPIWPLLLVRAVICSLVLVPLILYLGPPHRLLTPLWPLHVARALLFAFGFSLYYAAFPFMTLAAVTTIFFAAPLLTALFAAVFLKERIGVHRISALVLGFVGVIVAMKPGADSFQWVSMLPLICACSFATSQILARRIGDPRHRDGRWHLYDHSRRADRAAAGMGAERAVQYRPHKPRTCAGAGTLLPSVSCPGCSCWAPSAWSAGPCCPGLTRSPIVGAVAPFEYAYLPMAASLGYVAFDEIPALNTACRHGVDHRFGHLHRLSRNRQRASQPAAHRRGEFRPRQPRRDAGGSRTSIGVRRCSYRQSMYATPSASIVSVIEME